MTAKLAIWASVLVCGALLAILGATAASTADTGSGVGMIVLGLLVVSAGLSALLGLAHDPGSCPDALTGSSGLVNRFGSSGPTRVQYLPLRFFLVP